MPAECPLPPLLTVPFTLHLPPRSFLRHTLAASQGPRGDALRPFPGPPHVADLEPEGTEPDLHFQNSPAGPFSGSALLHPLQEPLLPPGGMVFSASWQESSHCL